MSHVNWVWCIYQLRHSKQSNTVNHLWYSKTPVVWLLLPVSLLFWILSTLRRTLYRTGVFKVTYFPAPVIIVGNINVGGTGKTPLVIWLTQYLKKQGYSPGIVSRGYGGKDSREPYTVTTRSDPAIVGDEPWLLAHRCQCPVVVNRNRPLAVEHLLENSPCDIVISDDGLQHYALGRNIEIVVVDGQRRFGNGFCLPAGPLRETKGRLKSIDLIVNNGGPVKNSEYLMQLDGIEICGVNNNNHMKRHPLSFLKGQRVHAIAGIGHPKRFFKYLKDFGLTIIEHPFPDHHSFLEGDFEFKDQSLPILMTEKDAMKCQKFAKDNYWYLPVNALMTDKFETQLNHLLINTLKSKKSHG